MNKSPAFLVRCRNCLFTIERESRKESDHAVDLHIQATGHLASIYVLVEQ
jgi:hypothetical protein